MVTKKEGYSKRQKDIGWGYALAHLIPFVAIYYAISRRTVTPFLFAFIGNITIGFIFGFFYALINPNFNEKNLENSATLLSLVTTPVLTKKGIEKARIFGRNKLTNN